MRKLRVLLSAYTCRPNRGRSPVFLPEFPSIRKSSGSRVAIRCRYQSVSSS